MRLLRIVAASNEEETISCETIHVLFGEKRKFEALSYRWGESMSELPILLNGVEIKVRQNLSDALCMLRRRAGPEKLYWIDALCINQDDVAERNLHLQLMRSIFFRAYTVLVWLGKMHDQYEPTVSELQDLDDAEKSKRSHEYKSLIEKKIKVNSLEMAEKLYQDQYWNRVWIVQEIGLARQIEVCLGESSINWSAFIKPFALHKMEDWGGPLRLNSTKANKHDGACRLIQLLTDYESSACQNPKDKVYGLIGLAKDAQCFPMDYNKSLFQIWTDVMEFLNDRELPHGKDIVDVGRQVKYILMGDQREPLERMMQPYAPADGTIFDAKTLKSSKVFKVDAKVLGCVRNVGPRPEEIICNPSKHNIWEKSVHDSVQDRHDHSESDKLLMAILNPDGPDLSLSCLESQSVVQWTSATYRGDRNAESQRKCIQEIQRFQGAVRKENKVSDRELGIDSPTSGTRLYQLSTWSDAQSLRVGLASDKVKQGDLVCWVKHSSRAVILRPRVETDFEVAFQAVGTAAMASDLQGIHRDAHADRYMRFGPRSDPSVDISLRLDSNFISSCWRTLGFMTMEPN